MKKFITILTGFALCISAFAGETFKEYWKVLLTTDHPDGVYAKGEKIVVSAKIEEDAPSEMFLDVTAGGMILFRGIIAVKPGQTMVVYEQSFDKPTSLMVGLGPVKSRAQSTRVGAIVAAEEFRPGFQEPSDLRSWWQGQISNMRESKAEAIVEEVAVPAQFNGTVRCYNLEIPMHQGNPVRAYLAIPQNAAPSSLPIYIYTHSAGDVRKPFTRSTIQKASQLASLGAIAIDINAHGMLNAAPDEYYEKLAENDLLMYEQRPVEDKESYYFRLMYLRLVRALDYLVTRPEWDGRRVMVQGDSQGGGQALALAGLDSRVSDVVAVVPALCDMGGSLDSRKSGWPFGLRPMVPLSSRGRSVLPYFDAALLCASFKGNLYVEAGLIDMVCDPSCVSAAFNNCGASSKTIKYFPYRTHKGVIDRYSKAWNEAVIVCRNEFFSKFFSR